MRGSDVQSKTLGFDLSRDGAEQLTTFINIVLYFVTTMVELCGNYFK